MAAKSVVHNGFRAMLWEGKVLLYYHVSLKVLRNDHYNVPY